jgi:prevent-host-death family protein
MQKDEETITATHLRRNLGAVLDAVMAGRVVHVERNGRPLVDIVPPQTRTREGDQA